MNCSGLSEAAQVCGANNSDRGNSCVISQAELGIYDTIVATRMLTSCLSIIGTLSIIIRVLGKRQAFKAKIHPLFVLSVADLILSCLWIIGGSFWMRDIRETTWCLAFSFFTIILQCVSINLTLVFAIFAYHRLKNTDLTKPLLGSSEDRVWKSFLTISIYIIAWVLPAVLVISVFAAVAGNTNIIREASACSCWCLPTYGNVLPYATPTDAAIARYIYNLSKLVESYANVVSVHYLVVFICLIIIYRKLLKHISKLRSNHERGYNTHGGGIPIPISTIILGQSKAKVRVYLYLLVFIINGFFRFVGYEAYRIPSVRWKCNSEETNEGIHSKLRITFFTFLILQSALPLQGFLNAIVYGWTREDFISDMAVTSPDLRTLISRDDQLSKRFTERQIAYVETEKGLAKKESLQDSDRLTTERLTTESMGVTDLEESEDNY